MPEKREKRDRDRVNPAARRDRPGEPHDDLARSGGDAPRDEEVRGYQEAELDPRDDGGIGS